MCLEGVLEIVHDGAVLEEPLDIVADVGGQAGDIGEGALLAGAINPLGFADKPGGIGVAIGTAGDIHGQKTTMPSAIMKPRNIVRICHSSTSDVKNTQLPQESGGIEYTTIQGQAYQRNCLQCQIRNSLSLSHFQRTSLPFST